VCLNWKHTPIASHVPRVLVLSPVLDHRGCGQRDYRLEPAEIKQPGTASAASPVRHQAGKALIPPDSRWLLRFSTRSPGEELQRLIAAEKFRATLPAKLDAAEDAWHATQPTASDPVIIEHPIDDTVQTGDSRLLGGAMEIKAPWKRD
jgi:hypothetical protein